MTDEEFEVWVKDYSSDQMESLRNLRSSIIGSTKGLKESLNEGKWLNGYIFYSMGTFMVYAIGVKKNSKISLHMMPLYGSEALQEKHGEALSPFLTGKSCIDFKDFGELPLKSLVDIFTRGTVEMIKLLPSVSQTKTK